MKSRTSPGRGESIGSNEGAPEGLIAITEVRSRAKEFLLDLVRQEPGLHFTKSQISGIFEAKLIKKRIGLSKDDKRSIGSILTGVAEQLNRQLTFFRIDIEPWGSTAFQLRAHLTENSEWSESLAEAWKLSGRKSETFLSDPSTKLLELIRSGTTCAEFLTERSLTWKMGLNGRQHCLESYLWEIAGKTGLPLAWESQGHRFREVPKYRIWLDPAQDTSGIGSKSLNPNLNIRYWHFTKADLDDVRATIYAALGSHDLVDCNAFFLFSISSRRELQHCFNASREITGDEIARFFASLHLNETLKLCYDFRSKAPRWYVAILPKVDWTSSLKAVLEELARPTAREQYGLSEDAAKLFEWIKSIPPEQMLGQWTPVVEDAREKWIGINCPWSGENFPAYLQMLLDEINNQTALTLSLQPWHDYGRLKSRIRVAQKRTDIEDVLKQLAVVAVARNVSLDLNEARRTIERLLVHGSAPL